MSYHSAYHSILKWIGDNSERNENKNSDFTEEEEKKTK
jgi:hypothetical protein